MPGWHFHLAVIAFVATVHAAPAAKPPDLPSTQELLNVLLTTHVGDQPTTDKGPCTRAGDAMNLRSDVIEFLAKLSSSGSITSACHDAGTTFECRLVIGRAKGRNETVWSRNYALALDKGDRRVKDQVDCYTIP